MSRQALRQSSRESEEKRADELNLRKCEEELINLVSYDIFCQRHLKGNGDLAKILALEENKISERLASVTAEQRPAILAEIREEALAFARAYVKDREEAAARGNDGDDGYNSGGGGGWDATADNAADDCTAKAAEAEARRRRRAEIEARRSDTTARAKRSHDSSMHYVDEMLRVPRPCDDCSNGATVFDMATSKLMCSRCDDGMQMSFASRGLSPSFTRYTRVRLGDHFEVGERVNTPFGRGVVTGISWAPESSRVLFYRVTFLRGGSSPELGTYRGELSPSCVNADAAADPFAPLHPGTFAVVKMSPNDFLSPEGAILSRPLPEPFTVRGDCDTCTRHGRPSPSRFVASSFSPTFTVVVHTSAGAFFCMRAEQVKCIEKGCTHTRTIGEAESKEENFNFAALSIHATVSIELLDLFSLTNFALKYTFPAEAAFSVLVSRCDAADLPSPPKEEFRAVLFAAYQLYATQLSSPTLTDLCILCGVSPCTLFVDGNAKLFTYRAYDSGIPYNLVAKNPVIGLPIVDKVMGDPVLNSSASGNDISACTSLNIRGDASHFTTCLGGNEKRRAVTGMVATCCGHGVFRTMMAMRSGEKHKHHFLAALFLAYWHVITRMGCIAAVETLVLFCDISCMVIRTLRKHSPIDASSLADILWPSKFKHVTAVVLDDGVDGRPVVLFCFTSFDGIASSQVRVSFVVDALHAKGHQCNKIYVSEFKQWHTSSGENSINRLSPFFPSLSFRVLCSTTELALVLPLLNVSSVS